MHYLRICFRGLRRNYSVVTIVVQGWGWSLATIKLNHFNDENMEFVYHIAFTQQWTEKNMHERTTAKRYVNICTAQRSKPIWMILFRCLSVFQYSLAAELWFRLQYRMLTRVRAPVFGCKTNCVSALVPFLSLYLSFELVYSGFYIGLRT